MATNSETEFMGGDDVDDADWRSTEAVVGTCPVMCPGESVALLVGIRIPFLVPHQ